MTETGVSAVEAALERAEWQAHIFATRPRRLELLRLRSSFPLRPLRAHVLRNQPFEYVATLARPFLAFAGWDVDFVYGPYDDSLASGADATADVEIVWLDYDRFALSSQELTAFLGDRLSVLRSATDRPIVVFDRAGSPDFNQQLAEVLGTLPGVHLVPFSDVARELGEGFVDQRMENIAGLALSDPAMIETARRLALWWLPAALGHGVKALVLDLDGTVWGGAVGEDGVDGIEITEVHQAVHRRLQDLQQGGVLLALVSRNEAVDVETAFTERSDLVLKLEDFTAVRCTWGAKSAAVQEVLDQLRIGADAATFIDDNPGEVAEVVSALPDIGTLVASGPDELLSSLRWYPGLNRINTDATGRLRARDIAANDRRARLAQEAADPREYVRSLQVVATFLVDDPSQLERLQQLSVKTNQFNTALARLSLAAVARYVAEQDRHAVAVAVRDRLADSGVVAAVFSRFEDAVLKVDEIAISCRALGRGVETAIILEAIRRSGAVDGGLVEIAYRPGPRNGPALSWLETELGRAPANGGLVSFRWDAERMKARVAELPVRMV